MMADCGVILSLLASDGFVSDSDDISRLICVSDGLPCRDFVNCFKYRFNGGDIVLLWVCPRFKPHRCVR
jgi:hypothetical protein